MAAIVLGTLEVQVVQRGQALGLRTAAQAAKEARGEKVEDLGVRGGCG